MMAIAAGMLGGVARGGERGVERLLQRRERRAASGYYNEGKAADDDARNVGIGPRMLFQKLFYFNVFLYKRVSYRQVCYVIFFIVLTKYMSKDTIVRKSKQECGWITLLYETAVKAQWQHWFFYVITTNVSPAVKRDIVHKREQSIIFIRR